MVSLIKKKVCSSEEILLDIADWQSVLAEVDISQPAGEEDVKMRSLRILDDEPVAGQEM